MYPIEKNKGVCFHMPVYVALIIGGVLALAATILIHIFILPEKKDHRLPKF